MEFDVCVAAVSDDNAQKDPRMKTNKVSVEKYCVDICYNSSYHSAQSYELLHKCQREEQEPSKGTGDEVAAERNWTGGKA